MCPINQSLQNNHIYCKYHKAGLFPGHPALKIPGLLLVLLETRITPGGGGDKTILPLGKVGTGAPS